MCIMSCPSISIAKCKTCTYIADNLLLTYVLHHINHTSWIKLTGTCCFLRSPRLTYCRHLGCDTLVGWYHCFEGTCNLHLHTSDPKKEAVYSSEASRTCRN